MLKVYPFKINLDGKYDQWASRFFATSCGDIYLHGKLDNDNGYDLCGLRHLPEGDGVYDCEVMMNDGNDVRQAKLFYWTTNHEGVIIDGNGCRHGKWVRRRGLVVQMGDEEGMQFAQKKFDKRTEFL